LRAESRTKPKRELCHLFWRGEPDNTREKEGSLAPICEKGKHHSISRGTPARPLHAAREKRKKCHLRRGREKKVIIKRITKRRDVSSLPPNRPTTTRKKEGVRQEREGAAHDRKKNDVNFCSERLLPPIGVQGGKKLSFRTENKKESGSAIGRGKETGGGSRMPQAKLTDPHSGLNKKRGGSGWEGKTHKTKGPSGGSLSARRKERETLVPKL